MNAKPTSRPAHLRQEFRGATFDVPEDWEEESVLYMRAPGPKPQPVLSLLRLSVPPGTPLEEVVSRKVAELSSNVAGLRVDETRGTVLASGERALRVKLAWEELEGAIEQRLVFVPVNQGRPDEGVFVLIGTSPPNHAAKLASVFDHALATLKIAERKGEAS